MSRKIAPTFTTGDRIAYSAGFLRNIGMKGRAEGLMRATVTAVYPRQNDSMGGIIEFTTDAGQSSGGLACNFVHDNPRDICVDATTNS